LGTNQCTKIGAENLIQVFDGLNTASVENSGLKMKVTSLEKETAEQKAVLDVLEQENVKLRDSLTAKD
jgi:cell division protein FtsB